MLIGDRRDERNRLRTISPLYQAADVRAPVLLIHGAGDTIVPVLQSQRMAAALRRAGKDVELIELPNADHWLSDPASRIAMLEALEAFLGANLRR